MGAPRTAEAGERDQLKMPHTEFRGLPNQALSERTGRLGLIKMDLVPQSQGTYEPIGRISRNQFARNFRNRPSRFSELVTMNPPAYVGRTSY